MGPSRPSQDIKFIWTCFLRSSCGFRPFIFRRRERSRRNGLSLEGGLDHRLSDEEGVVMPQQEIIAHRILKVVRRAPGCQLDELEQSLPGLTWNQIFLEVDVLSRSGQLQLTSLGHGDYTLMLPKADRKAKVSTVSRRKRHKS
jgi:hypothetical protein